jgi:hypothetical protein
MNVDRDVARLQSSRSTPSSGLSPCHGIWRRRATSLECIGRAGIVSPIPNTTEQILVAKVTQSGSCRVGTVSAHIPDAINIARKLADSRAERFRCGTDKPVTEPDPSANLVTESYDKLGQRETLDHNGSIMTLTRSNDGVVAIQYHNPRAELSVTPGTVLFRGQTDKTGRLTGVAYTFKPGCDPAAYPVRGEKAGGVVVLTGAAPKRDRRSCAIIGYDSTSTNSRLVFYHEAVSDF